MSLIIASAFVLQDDDKTNSKEHSKKDYSDIPSAFA